MSVVVFGATGQLGQLVLDHLLDRGVPAGDVVAVGRRVERLAGHAERGVRVVRADLEDPAALDGVLAAGDRVLLVSGTEPTRVAQHQRVIDAARAAGVAQLVYTSAPHADTTTMLLAADHAATERALQASGLPVTVLRNAWYVENYTAQLDTYRAHGMATAAGDGRVSVALRREYAAAAATVLTTDGHVGATYELGGPAVTLREVAAAISAASGADVAVHDVSVDQLRRVLEGAGLPGPAAAVFADVDRAIAAGELQVDPAVLAGLVGRTSGLQDAVAEALGAPAS